MYMHACMISLWMMIWAVYIIQRRPGAHDIADVALLLPIPTAPHYDTCHGISMHHSFRLTSSPEMNGTSCILLTPKASNCL